MKILPWILIVLLVSSCSTITAWTMNDEEKSAQQEIWRKQGIIEEQNKKAEREKNHKQYTGWWKVTLTNPINNTTNTFNLEITKLGKKITMVNHSDNVIYNGDRANTGNFNFEYKGTWENSKTEIGKFYVMFPGGAPAKGEGWIEKGNAHLPLTLELFKKQTY
jgi:hypothetical protein